MENYDKANFFLMSEEFVSSSALYNNLRNQGTIDFLSTSFLRGITIDNGVIIVDECQNLNFHEF